MGYLCKYWSIWLVEANDRLNAHPRPRRHSIRRVTPAPQTTRKKEKKGGNTICLTSVTPNVARRTTYIGDLRRSETQPPAANHLFPPFLPSLPPSRTTHPRSIRYLAWISTDPAVRGTSKPGRSAASPAPAPGRDDSPSPGAARNPATACHHPAHPGTTHHPSPTQTLRPRPATKRIPSQQPPPPPRRPQQKQQQDHPPHHHRLSPSATRHHHHRRRCRPSSSTAPVTRGRTAPGASGTSKACSVCGGWRPLTRMMGCSGCRLMGCSGCRLMGMGTQTWRTKLGYVGPPPPPPPASICAG